MSEKVKQRTREFKGMLLRNMSVRLTYWHVRKARRLGKGNVSDGIRYAIEETKEREKDES